MEVSLKVSLLLPELWHGVSFKIFLRNFSRLILGREFIMRKMARDPCVYHGIPKGRKTGRK